MVCEEAKRKVDGAVEEETKYELQDGANLNAAEGALNRARSDLDELQAKPDPAVYVVVELEKAITSKQEDLVVAQQDNLIASRAALNSVAPDRKTAPMQGSVKSSHFKFIQADAFTMKNLLASLTIETSTFSRSEYTKVNVGNSSVNTCTALRVFGKEGELPEDWFGGGQTEIKTDEGSELGVLLFLYSSHKLTLGAVYAVVLLSLEPLRYAIGNVTGECRMVVPVQVVDAGIWEQTRDLAVHEWIAKKHSDRLSVVSPPTSKKRLRVTKTPPAPPAPQFACRAPGCVKSLSTVIGINKHMTTVHPTLSLPQYIKKESTPGSSTKEGSRTKQPAFESPDTGALVSAQKSSHDNAQAQRGKGSRGGAGSRSRDNVPKSQQTTLSGSVEIFAGERYAQLQQDVLTESKKRKRVEDLQQETASKVLMLEAMVAVGASPDGLSQHLQAFERAQQPVFAVVRQALGTLCSLLPGHHVPTSATSAVVMPGHQTELPPSEEFDLICKSYTHVEWHLMTWVDFRGQSSTELADMLADPAAKLNRAHKLALTRLHRVGAAAPTSR